MERKMDFWTIEIATKFENKKDAIKLQKNIIDKFNYECGVHKDYKVQAIIGVSNINGKYVKGIYNKQTGKSGRPVKIKDVMEETDYTIEMYGTLHTKWHLHILVLSSPSETLAQAIKDYLAKNWNIVAYKKFIGKGWGDIDIGKLFYIAKQSDVVKFFGSNDKRFKYTFRNMYDAMVKQYSNLLFNKRYVAEKEYREKADKRYNDMISYFSQFYDEELKKEMERRYKEKVKRRKITERYKKMEERDNKVLKKRDLKNDKDVLFIGG